MKILLYGKQDFTFAALKKGLSDNHDVIRYTSKTKAQSYKPDLIITSHLAGLESFIDKKNIILLSSQEVFQNSDDFGVDYKTVVRPSTEKGRELIEEERKIINKKHAFIMRFSKIISKIDLLLIQKKMTKNEKLNSRIYDYYIYEDNFVKTIELFINMIDNPESPLNNLKDLNIFHFRGEEKLTEFKVGQMIANRYNLAQPDSEIKTNPHSYTHIKLQGFVIKNNFGKIIGEINE
jgi:dTDP-4-dehydrorhamnose reductase